MGFNKQRLIILGLDGMPFSLLKKLTENGYMPAAAEILKNGRLIQIDASIPDISSVSWSTFITGEAPTKHGILGFVDMDPSTYKLIFLNFLHNESKTFWEKLSENGKECIILNIPGTYPARPYNGILISGFPAVSLEKAVYPSSLASWVRESGYILDVDPPTTKEMLDSFFSTLIKAMEVRMSVFQKLNSENSWDVFFACFTEIDRFHHFFFGKIKTSNNENPESLMQFYKSLDKYISEIYSWCSDNDKFIMISDHGFTQIEEEFYINVWLKENGFLENVKFENGKLCGITSKTKAFALDPCRIFIHLKNKYANGNIDSGKEYDKLREEIIEKLIDLEFNGKKVIKKALKKEDIYPEGTCFNKAADIICLPEDGFDIKGSFQKESLFGKSIFTGMHTQYDAMFYINNVDFKTDHKLNISELYSLFIN